MNAQTITMEPEAAAAKLAACKRELLKRHSAEVREQFEQLKRGYEALEKGTPLINPLHAIRQAGWKEDGSGPKLAIVRADQSSVRLESSSNDWWDHEKKVYRQRDPRLWTWRFVVDSDIRNFDRFEVTAALDHPLGKATNWQWRPRAMTPLIPPDIMPARGLDRSKHLILWEVESWDMAPPVDPMLLKPIGGGLYAVVAQWDLTPLEQEILRDATRL